MIKLKGKGKMIMRYTVPTHTREQNDRRNFKIVYVLVLIFVGIACYMIGSGGDYPGKAETPTPKTQATKIKEDNGVPQCDLEDGSTQEVCWWHDAANGRYLNINYGQYVYVPMNDEMINWKE